MKGSLWTVATIGILGGLGVALALSGASADADAQNDSIAASIDATAPGIEPLFGLLMVAAVVGLILGAGRFQ